MMAKRGGQGGDASVEGDSSVALGGDAGDAVVAPGGRGGHAKVKANFAFGKGGKGGRGGVTPGMPGGDVLVEGNGFSAFGGQGGEAPQADGRGGRGGLAHSNWPMRSQAHMRLHWDEKNNDPGRGGDGAVTSQYKARRIILENLKEDDFASDNILIKDIPYKVWYDRKTVSLKWLNSALKAEKYRWRVTLSDEEYEFFDLHE